MDRRAFPSTTSFAHKLERNETMTSFSLRTAAAIGLSVLTIGAAAVETTTPASARAWHRGYAGRGFGYGGAGLGLGLAAGALAAGAVASTYAYPAYGYTYARPVYVAPYYAPAYGYYGYGY
jgi:hypothetical protein